MDAIDRLLETALAEEGYQEKSASAYNRDRTILDRKHDGAGSDNYTKYGRDMHNLMPTVMDFPAAWCDAYVDWCFYKTFGKYDAMKLLCGSFDDYTVASKEYYVKKGRYSKTPKRGDQIFFKNSVRVCHTGLVTKVTDTYVYTIEGNTSAAVEGLERDGGHVAQKYYKRTSTYIDGYGHPDYDALSGTSTTTKKEDTFTLEFKTLKKGSKGIPVKALQRNLTGWGYKCTVDGDFGSQTDKQVKAFQSKYNLTVDGEVGKKTYSKLNGLS